MGLLGRMFDIHEKRWYRIFKLVYNVFMFCFFVALMFSLRMMYDTGYSHGYAQCRNEIILGYLNDNVSLDFPDFDAWIQDKSNVSICQDYCMTNMSGYDKEHPIGYSLPEE
jgi:hypothetical protein